MILFAFALSVLVVHFSDKPERSRKAMSDVAMPFSYANGKVQSLQPEGENSGI